MIVTGKAMEQTARSQAFVLLGQAHIQLSESEKASLDVIDFGLGDIGRYGVQLIEYVNNDRYCARQLVFLPYQTIPEHMHPPVGEDPGKVETFRVVWGSVLAYTEQGEQSGQRSARLAEEDEAYFHARHEIPLEAGEQCTIEGNQFHWFQAGERGAVVIEFSSPARDRFDRFRDPRVVREIGAAGSGMEQP
ncbi:hypothetical protein AK95_04175 [Paenibacillus sp. LC231]|nr:hypothetical protein AK95_04175 [Paenibacillus sp. LC231]